MLEVAVRFPLLAFGIPGLAPDEHLSGTQPNDGATMSLIEKSDVKDQLSPRDSTKIHLCEPVSQPDATGFSEAEPEATQSKPTVFAKDFVAEHSTAGAAVTPNDRVTVSNGPKAMANKKSAQA
jgi:hypothetical protein